MGRPPWAGATCSAPGGPPRRTCTSPVPAIPSLFGSPEQAEFAHGKRTTAAALVAKIATHAGVLVLPEEEREDLLGRIREELASRPETAEGEFDVPMLTGVLRVRS